MATTIRIIHAHDFVRATPEGHLDFGEAKRLLVEIASASASLPECEVILDSRKARVQISVAELWHLAGVLSELRGEVYRKTAVLCPLEDFDKAEFFTLCAENRGLDVRAFTSFEDAIQWLFAGSGA